MLETGKVTAETMAFAVEFDRQFQMPRRPRFIAELTQLWLGDCLIIDGTSELQVLRGGAVRTLLPRLIPLLDGRRTVTELELALPDTDCRVIRSAVALLYTRGLLEDAASDDDSDASEFDPEVLSFCRRNVDATRVNRSGLEALVRLRDCSVFVSCSGAHSEAASRLILQHLRKAGVEDVHILTLGRDLLAQFQSQPRKARSLTIYLACGEDSERHARELDGACCELDIPWLRVSFSPESRTAEIGPYFERGVTPCYRCVAAMSASGRNKKAMANRDSTCDSLNIEFWATMLALETIYLLTRIGPLASGIHIMSYDTEVWTTSILRFARRPGCPACHPSNHLTAVTAPETAVMYEEAVGFPPRHLLDPKSHQAHYQVSNLAMTEESKQYPGGAVISLPKLQHLPKPVGDLGSYLVSRAPHVPLKDELDIPHLTALLLFTGGIREQIPNYKVQRWTATGGNLGSPELYVAARDVSALSPGIYFYDRARHALVRIPGFSSREQVTEFMRTSTRFKTDFSAMIICTAALHRIFRKYGPFAYRVVHLDAGIAGAQLQLVARGLRIGTYYAKEWADTIVSNALGLAEGSELVTGVVAIGQQGHLYE